MLDWNEKINLISRKDTEQVSLHHIVHSLSILKYFQFVKGQTILDIGTGGGLPGIPLAICFPNVEFVLSDSIEKKTLAVFDMAESLDLENVTVAHGRSEKIKQKFDFVVTRAVAKTPKLINWSKSKIKRSNLIDQPNGLIALKGGDLSEELEDVQYPNSTYSLSKHFTEEFFETKKLVYVRLSN